MQKELSPPLISILTRCKHNTECLAKNLESLLNQADPDFEHITIPPKCSSSKLVWANSQLARCQFKAKGRYVLILDEHLRIVCETFIADLRALLLNLEPRIPDVIVCKGQINYRTMPKRWKGRTRRGEMGCANLIIARDIFNEFFHLWITPIYSEFLFFNTMQKLNKNIFWWDKKIFSD